MLPRYPLHHDASTSNLLLIASLFLPFLHLSSCISACFMIFVDVISIRKMIIIRC